MKKKLFKVKNKIKKYLSKYYSNISINFIFFIFFILTFFIFEKLYRVQVIAGAEYNQRVLVQTGNFEQKVEKQKRGSLFFKNQGVEVAVAIDVVTYILAIEPKHLQKEDKVKIYNDLNNIVEIDKDDFDRKMAKVNDPYEELKKQVSEEKALKIRSLAYPGVVLVKDFTRTYPFRDVSSKVIGFTDYNKNGVYGLEFFYNDILKRDGVRKDKSLFRLFFEDKTAGSLFSQKKISKEGDLVSSIDVGLSSKVEEILKYVDEKYESKYTAAIITRPDNGEVVAMTDSKGFDLNIEKGDYRNIFVEQRFEVGSVFKPLVVAMGLESGKIDSNFSYHDKGCIDVLENRVCNYDKRGRGVNTDLEKILSQSLNTGMVEIGRKIGKRNFLEYTIKLGLAEETGIDLGGEISSSINSLNGKVEMNYAAASFGQGISFTPIGIMKALSAIAADGYMSEPHLVQEINYGSLIPSKKIKEEKVKVFSPETILNVKGYMVQTAKNSLENKKYSNSNYIVGTKTGTAQIASPDGGYYEDKVIHTFFGFFPAYGPVEDRYAIFLYTVEPKGVRFSSETLTKPFYDISNFMISYFNIKPDNPTISK